MPPKTAGKGEAQKKTPTASKGDTGKQNTKAEKEATPASSDTTAKVEVEQKATAVEKDKQEGTEKAAKAEAEPEKEKSTAKVEPAKKPAGKTQTEKKKETGKAAEATKPEPDKEASATEGDKQKSAKAQTEKKPEKVTSEARPKTTGKAEPEKEKQAKPEAEKKKGKAEKEKAPTAKVGTDKGEEKDKEPAKAKRETEESTVTIHTDKDTREVKEKAPVNTGGDDDDLPPDDEEVDADTAESDAAEAAAGLHAAMSAGLKEKVSQKELMKMLSGLKLDKKPKNAAVADHKFWNTQPVPQTPQTGERAGGETKERPEGEIETKTVAEVRAEPYLLPEGFEWSNCDMSDAATVEEVYTLLCENYVEDDDNMFRFDYSKNFLQWALKPPGYIRDWHVGVRVTRGTKKLVGFITGVPALMSVYTAKKKMAEINFLCVHKKLRNKRLAPVLIKEITRRVNLLNIWQAVYTAGVVLPQPVARNRYYHRSLNPKKLIDIGFSHLQAHMTLSRLQKLNKLPTESQTPGFRPLEKKDCPVANRLLNTYLNKFGLHQSFCDDEFEHAFVTKEGVVYSFVVEDAAHQVTDMCSFYSLPSTIIGNKSHSTLRAAYSYYNVSTKTPWLTLMTEALIQAKNLGFDVFNALDVMENEEFLKPLKFGIGDGHLQYYLYNWSCPEMKPKQVGLVLL